jgi:flagellar biogenesis protein FliO
MEALQPVFAVLFVLGLMGGALYWLRAKGLARFNGKAIGRAGARRMRVVERLPLTPHHSLHLVTVGSRSVLVAVSPGGCTVVDAAAWQIPGQTPAGEP